MICMCFICEVRQLESEALTQRKPSRTKCRCRYKRVEVLINHCILFRFYTYRTKPRSGVPKYFVGGVTTSLHTADERRNGQTENEMDGNGGIKVGRQCWTKEIYS